MARLRSVGISPVFREALYSSWRGWDRLLLHCLRSIAENSLGPPEELCEIVYIASMMSSLVILMSDSVFQCGCPKKSFGYLIVIVGSGVLKSLLYCWFSSSFIFLLLCSKFPSSSWIGPIPALIFELFFTNLQKYSGFFLIAAIALVSLRFLSVCIEIFKLFSISLIWFSTFFLVWWFVDICIFFCNYDLFFINDLLFLGIWCFLELFFGRTYFLQISRQILITISYISSVFISVKSMSQLVLCRSASILARLMKKFKSL